MASFAESLPYDFRMATAAELQIWGLILHQQRPRCAGMRLMATQAAHLHLDLAVVQWVVDIGHRVPDHWMSKASLEREMNHLGEIIRRQFYFAVEDQRQMILRIDGRLGVWTMAFEAERVPLCAQQFRMLTSMRIVTGGAPLLKGGLMQYFLAV